MKFSLSQSSYELRDAGEIAFGAQPHVAFEVDDLHEAIRGKKVIIEPNEPAPGVLVAFIEEAGALVELLQFSEKGASNPAPGGH